MPRTVARRSPASSAEIPILASAPVSRNRFFTERAHVPVLHWPAAESAGEARLNKLKRKLAQAQSAAIDSAQTPPPSDNEDEAARAEIVVQQFQKYAPSQSVFFDETGYSTAEFRARAIAPFANGPPIAAGTVFVTGGILAPSASTSTAKSRRLVANSRTNRTISDKGARAGSGSGKSAHTAASAANNGGPKRKKQRRIGPIVAGVSDAATPAAAPIAAPFAEVQALVGKQVRFVEHTLAGLLLNTTVPQTGPYTLSPPDAEILASGTESLKLRASFVKAQAQKRAFWVQFRKQISEGNHDFLVFPNVKFRSLDLFAICQWLKKRLPTGLTSFDGLPQDLEWWQGAVETTDRKWQEWIDAPDIMRTARQQKVRDAVAEHATELFAAWTAAAAVADDTPLEPAAFPLDEIEDSARIYVRCVCGHVHYEFTGHVDRHAITAREREYLAVRQEPVPMACAKFACHTCQILPGGNVSRVICRLCGMAQHVSCCMEEGLITRSEGLALLMKRESKQQAVNNGGAIHSSLWTCEICDDSQPAMKAREWSRRGLTVEIGRSWNAERRQRGGRSCIDYWVFPPNTACSGRNGKDALRSLSNAPVMRITAKAQTTERE